MSVHVPDKPHAVLGPSKWDQWGTCPGSIPLTEGLPNNSSGYAREGNAAHALLEDCLEGGFDAEDLLGREYEVEGETFVVDMDMADAVNTAIGWVKQEIDPDKGDVLLVEQQVPISQLTGETDAVGSSDVIGICDDGKLLVVMDYKHGKGVQVYATEKHDCYEGFEGPDAIKDSNGEVVLALCKKCGRGEIELEEGCLPNGQMAMYGLGALHMLIPIYDTIERVKLVIMQPRIDWYDSIEMPVAKLLEFGEKVAEAAGMVELNRQVHAEGNSLDLVPSDKGCKFCKAKHFCPALKGVMTNALAVASTAEDFDDLTLPKKAASVVIDEQIEPEKLAEMMRAAPMIETILKAVRAEVERRLFDGQQVPGFYLGEGKRGNRAWIDEDQAAIELTKSGRLKVDEAFEKKVLSPTKAEKALKDRPKIWAKIAPLIHQPEGKPSVCADSDKNPPYRLPSPEDFEDLTVEPEGAAIEASVDPFS